MYFWPERSPRSEVTMLASNSFWWRAAKSWPGREKETMPLAVSGVASMILSTFSARSSAGEVAAVFLRASSVAEPIAPRTAKLARPCVRLRAGYRQLAVVADEVRAVQVAARFAGAEEDSRGLRVPGARCDHLRLPANNRRPVYVSRLRE